MFSLLMVSQFDSLKITPTDLLEEYLKFVPKDIDTKFATLVDAEISNQNFSFYSSVASVYSSKIEGEGIDLDSYVKHKRFGVEYLPDYTKKTDDLYNAYQFGKENTISKENIEHIHALLSANILPNQQRGKLRTQNMYVTTSEGKIDYVAASPFEVEGEMAMFYHDLDLLKKQEMSIQEVFYFASMLHLVFVKILPWMDGNGRSARLLEKWF